MSSTREFPLNDEMTQLLKVTRIHAIDKTLFVENAKAEPAVSQFRQQNEQNILSGIIQYECELGREPQLLDLLCRFGHAEIDAVRTDLEWLYPSMFVPVEWEPRIPQMVVP
jgi:hypothetical protein